MSVPFSDLYKYIRAAVGDYDTNFPLYANATLDAQLALLALERPDIWPLESENAFQDLEPQQKARISLYAARYLLSPGSNAFSYRTPVLSVSRAGGPAETVAQIDKRLAALEAKQMIASDSDIEALLQLGPSRLPVDVAMEVGFSP